MSSKQLHLGHSIVKIFRGIFGLDKEEKRQMDRRTIKLLTMHKGLHPKSNVGRLYIPIKECGEEC